MSLSTCSSKQIKVTIILMIIMYATLYVGILFELLSVNPYLSVYSNICQILVTILTFIQGPLFLLYTFRILCNSRVLWNTLCRHARRLKRFCQRNETNTLSSSSGNRRNNRVIPTDTNQAYQTVMLHNVRMKKEQQYNMTKNAVYDNVRRNTECVV